MWLSLIKPITLRAEAARAREARVRELGFPDVDTYLSDRIRGRLVSAHRGEPTLEAAYVPDAGMVGCSLLHRGEELLGPAGRPARLRRLAQDDGRPDAVPVGVARNAPRGHRGRRRARRDVSG
jgi:hypothetical protein